MAANLQPISSDGGFTSGGNININNGSSIVTAIDEDLNIIVQDEEDDGWSLQLKVTDGSNVHSIIDQQRDNIQIGVGITTGPAYYWDFDDQGRLNLPDGGNIQGAYGNNSSYYAIDNGSGGAVEMKVLSYIGDSLIANIRVSNPNVTISTSGGTNTWTFDNGGNLVFPRDAAGNTDPILTITGGASPRILSEDVSLAGPANLEITALNTIFTGSSGDEIRIYPDDGEIGSTGNLQLWANAGSNVAQYNWTFDTTGNLTVPGNTTVSTANATSGAAGKNISVIAGAADQSDYYTTSGGNVNITGGLGATNDGGGGGPGGWVNITSGASADPVGVYGNVKINTGGSNTWTFDNTGNLTASGAITASGKIGYANGGTVTQTGTGQGVTINQLTGQITLAKSSWTAGDLEIFNVNCNKVGTYDYVMAQVINGTESTFFNVVAFPYVPLANSFQIQVRAMETTTSTPLVQFFIMKAAIS